MYLWAFSCTVFKNVTCLDMITAMLAIGKGAAERLPFSDNSFDIVILRLAFHHFPNPKRCFIKWQEF